MRALPLALSLAISTVALGQRARPQRQPQPAPLRYDFDGDVVDGDLISPDSQAIVARRSAQHPSLIHVRETFVPELVKSAESI